MGVLVMSTMSVKMTSKLFSNFGRDVKSVFFRSSDSKVERILTNTFSTTTRTHVTNDNFVFSPLSRNVVFNTKKSKKSASSKFMSPSWSKVFPNVTWSCKVDVSESFRLREKDVFGNVHVSIMPNKAESKK